jgi:hypothetical protein
MCFSSSFCHCCFRGRRQIDAAGEDEKDAHRLAQAANRNRMAKIAEHPKIDCPK